MGEARVAIIIVALVTNDGEERKIKNIEYCQKNDFF